MQFFDELEGLVSNQLGVIKTCLTMTKLEARLAGLSIAPLLVCVCLLFIGCISVWLSGITLLGYALILATNNIMIALVSIFVANILMLGIVYNRMRRNLRNMSFEKTRAFLSQGRESHEIEKTDKDCLGNPRNELMDTTGTSQ